MKPILLINLGNYMYINVKKAQVFISALSVIKEGKYMRSRKGVKGGLYD